MIVLSPEEMRKVDKKAVEAGFPELILMEIAGRGVAEKARLILERSGNEHEHPHEHDHKHQNNHDNYKDKVLIIAGKGNNGGDGLVAARYLDIWGFRVKVLLLAAEEELKASSLENCNLCTLRGIDIEYLEGIDEGKLKEIENLIRDADLLIDAMLGTGIKGSVKQPYSILIDLINQAANSVLAVDIPSGIDGGNAKILGKAIRADFTITMAYPKLGLLAFPGRNYCGEIEIVDLGIPVEYALEQNPTHFVLDNDEALYLLPERAKNSHKGSFGKVGVIGGSPGMSGAPFLTGFAALNVGAGLVRVAVPEEIQSIVAGYSPELMTIGLKSSEDFLEREDLDKIDKLMDNSTVMAVGPGLGVSDASSQILEKLLREYPGTIIIDADGINSLNNFELLSKREKPTILTPHPGEMAGLLGKDIQDIQADRINIARNFALDYNVFLILKGAATVIALPEGIIYINPSGNEGMATAGSGDVLTGIIAGLLGMGLEAADAAILSPYLHGLAGDIATAELSSYSMTAGDIITFIGKAVNYLRQG